MPLPPCARLALLFLGILALPGCATTQPSPYGETYEPDSPALPTDIHPEPAGTFANRTYHN
jgi:hypothetical protein